VADPKLLDGVAVGDRVRFVAERVNGQFTITALSKTR
jgi:Cu(I)/Ag(I) efflux system protein CusF